MNEFFCPICQKEATQVNTLDLLGLIQSATYQCKKCGVFFRHPLPKESDVQRYYQSRYFRHPDKIEKDMARIQGTWLANKLNNITASEKAKFSFIEFGCGRGWLVGFMVKKQLVASAVGFDPDAKSVKWGKENLSIDVRVGALKKGLKDYDLNDDRESIPLIALMHVLEHLHSPVEVINKILKEKYGNHYLFVEVPDGEYEGNVMELDTLSGSSMGQHFWSFSKKSIELILKNAGYSIISLTREGNPSFWRNRIDNLKILHLNSLLCYKWDKKGGVGIREAFFGYLKLACLCFLLFLKNRSRISRLTRLDLPVIRVLAKFEK